ncbi:MAG: RNA polymerase sigma factor [Gemmatimonadota bacterium]
MGSTGEAVSPTDGEVVSRVLNGDREAYRILVRRHQDALFAHAVRMTGQGDVAADVVQGSLIKAYTRLDRCENPERFGAWVFRIVSNQCKDHLKNVRRRNVDLDSIEPPTGADDPDRDLEQSELRARLDAALAQLPADQREAFVLKHEEGRSYEEMAELLGASVGALKMRVHRARETLVELLDEVRI